MILSHKYNFLFIHIPKTAGTTISLRLQEILDPNTDVFLSKGNVRPDNYIDAGFDPDVRIIKHSGVTALKASLGEQAFGKLFTFAVMRNPYSRFLSAFSFAKRKAIEYWDQPSIAPYRRRFRDWSIEDCLPALEEHAARTFAFRPQVSFVPEPGNVTWLARFEHLEDDLRELTDRLSLPVLSKADKNPELRAPPDAWRSMPQTVKQAVADFYADDFRTFGYDVNDHEVLASASPA